MILLEDVSFSYPASREPALSGLTFSISQPAGIGLVGESGAGKSTLLKLLAGFVPCFVPGQLRGRARVCGRTAGDRAGDAALVFADPARQLSGTCETVREEVAWGLENLAVPRDLMVARLEAVLERLGLLELAHRPPEALSGGEQQRVALASVMVLEPRVLLLDEPSATLDPGAAQEVQRLAQGLVRAGTLVIWATPRLEEVGWCDRWLALQKGRLAYDGPAAILPESGALEAPWTRLARQLEASRLWSGPLPVREQELLEGLRAPGG
ncbi:MAG: ABC transporter ATP-binding protein [Armatimonadetes bacterium]|nr:ABC transporter ATP-binding protein [Armatimonadota bacterium]